MTKCDFCVKSNADGKCSWTSHVAAESDCRKAIEKMTRALSGVDFTKDSKRGKPFR